MKTQKLSDIFSLFRNINIDILERFLSIANLEEYQAQTVLIDEESWGSNVYFIVSGWIKRETIEPENKYTLEIMGKGSFIGEEGILTNNTLNSQIVTISDVQLLIIPAQQFLQFLYQYTQILNRFLSITINRVKEYQKYCQFYRQPIKVRLATILIDLAQKYGEETDEGILVYNFLEQDLADLAQLSIAECRQILSGLQQKNLLIIESDSDSLYFPNLKLLHHTIGKLGQ